MFYHPKPQAHYFAQRNCSGHIYKLNSIEVSPGALLGANVGEFPLGQMQEGSPQGQNEEVELEMGMGRAREGRGNRQRVPTFTRG